jgi:hypothetical protein
VRPPDSEGPDTLAYRPRPPSHPPEPISSKPFPLVTRPMGRISRCIQESSWGEVVDGSKVRPDRFQRSPTSFLVL